jgi:hypothetical protein
MSNASESASRTVSRRGLIVLGAGLTCAAGTLVTAAAAGAQTAAAKKMSQATAGYQAKPMGRAKCDLCSLWQAPASCKLVLGPISPSGWCNLYAAKT